MSRLRFTRRQQGGQSLVEYALIAGVLAAALFVPMYGSKTGAQYLADLVKAFFVNLTFFLSLP